MRVLGLVFALLAASTSSLMAACNGTDLRPSLDADVMAEIAQVVAQTPYAEGNLWQAERDGEVVYVLGTIHLGDPRLEPHIANLKPYIEEARLVFLEVTSEEEARISSDPSVILLPGATTLVSLLTEDQWTTVAEALRARGTPPFAVSRMQPFFLATILAIPPCAMSNLHALPGVDAQVEEWAKGRSIPTASLESIDEVIGLIRDFPMDLQIKMLLSSLHKPDLADDILETLITGYLDQSTAEAWEVQRVLSKDTAITGMKSLEDAAQIMDEIEGRLLVKRNGIWMPRLLAEVGPQPIFVAVGAAHLPGEDGLLNQLAAEGFSLTRLPF